MLVGLALLLSSICFGSVDSVLARAHLQSDSSRTATASTATGAFVPMSSTRVLGADAPVALSGGRIQYLTVAGRNGVPMSVTAARLVVTFSPAAARAEVRVHGSGSTPPLIPSIVAGPVGEPVVRTVTVAVGANGQVEFRPTAAGTMTVDLVGAYVPTTAATAGRFVTIDPLSVADVPTTRSAELALPSVVPSDATAVVLSVTAWNASAVGTWTTSDGSPVVMAVPGRVTANEIVAQPSNGRVTLTGSASSRIAVELVGWYTGSSATSGSDGLLVMSAGVRLVDTTSVLNPLGAGVALHARWTLEAALGSISGARAVIARVGVSAAHGTGAVSIHAAGRPRPTYGQIPIDGPGSVVVSQSTVGVTGRGVAAYSSAGNDLTLDVIGYFTGSAQSAPSSRPVNVMPASERFPGLLVVPRIKLMTWVLDDTELVDFDPAHLPESRTPNQPGNTALFGHRTSKGREFRNIDRMKAGDPIYLAVQGKVYVYAVTGVQVLSPDDPRLYASSSNDQSLTLVACHPPGSIKQRIVVFARLIDVAAF